MRKRMVLSLAIGGVFVLGLLLGGALSGILPVFAANQGNTGTTAQTTKGAYCQLYEQQLANNLHVSTAQLEQANAAAMQSVIDQMAKDGKITAAQKTQLEQKLQQLKSAPCAHIGQLGVLGRHGGGKFGAALQGAHTAIAQATASALHISTDTLASDLANGQTISQIAQAQKVNISDVNSAYLGAVQTQLKQAVSAGNLTQQQSDAIYAQMQQAVNGGHYPLLERHAGKGMMPAPAQ